MSTYAHVAPQRHTKAAGETEFLSVSFLNRLESGELLTGVPTIVEVGTSDLTLASKAVNTVALEINGVTVAIGQAVQCSVAGGTAGLTYTIQITVGTDAAPARTLIGVVKLKVVGNAP